MPESPIPAHILIAQTIADEFAGAAAGRKADDLRRLLPSLAAMFKQTGTSVTPDLLRVHAQQGPDHIRQQIRTLQAANATPPDYDRIAAQLKLPIIDRVPDPHLSPTERLLKSLTKNDLPSLKALAEEHEFDFSDLQMLKLLGSYAIDHRNREMLDYVIDEAIRRFRADGIDSKLDDATLEKMIIHVSSFSTFLKRDVEGVEFLHSAGMDLDTIYTGGFKGGSEDVLDYCRRHDPAIVDRHIDLIFDDLTLLNAMAVPYILEHATPIAPSRHEEIFEKLLLHVMAPDLERCCQHLSLSRDILSEALVKVAVKKPSLLQTLHDLGGDFTWHDNLPVKAVIASQEKYNLHYLESQGIDLDAIAEPGALDDYRQAVARRARWEDLHAAPPPKGLEWEDPERLNASAFHFITTCLKKEDRSHSVWQAWAFSQLLPTDRQVATFLERWGVRDAHPLFTLIRDVRLPDGDIDCAAWGKALLEYGPEAVKMLPLADHLPQPLPTLAATRDYLSQFAYRRGGEHPELARLFYRFAKDDAMFDRAIDLYQQQEALGFPAKTIPDLSIEGEAFGLPGGRFRRLAPDDPRGLILGELIGCCQSIGSEGEECAINGFCSPEAGFYVIENDAKDIIGITWAWRGDQGEMVFDSLEAKRKAVSSDQWQALIKQVRQALAATPEAHDVSALLIGTGGNTPKDMGFEVAPIPAKPRDHQGYEDSKSQWSAWIRPPGPAAMLSLPLVRRPG